MLGNFVGYLFGSNYSGTQDSLEEDPRTRGIMRRFRQVEVENDEWILIDRTVEGTLEEPWYEMPPAVFTQEGPIKVATSPMENLLIEHPSMSVYSVVSGTSPPVTPDTPPPSPDRWIEGQKDVDVRQTTHVSQNVVSALLADRSFAMPLALCTVSTPLDSSNLAVTLDRSNIDELSRRVVAELQAIHNDRLPTSDSNNNRARIGKQLRSAQGRAQEVLQKRSTQSLKRARMERSNKVRQAKGKRLRRQDRLRVCHSGANNNRKC
ncbi:Tumor protein p53-inducible nuclear protein 2 [Formica fusca]